VRRAKEEKRRREKKLRRKQDALKSALKRLKPSIETTSKWEDFESVITQLPEYHDLKDESLAKEVFDKFVVRLSEKAEKKRTSDDDEEEGMIRDDDADAAHHGRRHHGSQQASVYNGAVLKEPGVSNIATFATGT
ncbi:hypothetical protein INT44_000815, partial [Umbelopsis vinacea]